MAKRIVVTGGAGFIGSNYVARCIERGDSVVVFDDLSRAGAHKNLLWLTSQYPSAFEFINEDVRNSEAVARACEKADVVYHLAAQVAVTSSVLDPRHDFEVNALGTLNVLEAARKSQTPPLVVYSSTNKVYGGLESLVVNEEPTRYAALSLPSGIPESYPLDFHSPYGCSKGCADQYVRDFGRIYGIPTVVLRQSCIYGPRQFGIEDQGWVAWFIICGALGRQFRIYGDGKQVRDLLYVDDLLDLFDSVEKHPDRITGTVLNAGGGISNSLSVWTEFEPILTRLFGKKLIPEFSDWRPGDQRFFVADVSLADSMLGWKPKINLHEGLTRLFDWVISNKKLFE